MKVSSHHSWLIELISCDVQNVFTITFLHEKSLEISGRNWLFALSHYNMNRKKQVIASITKRFSFPFFFNQSTPTQYSLGKITNTNFHVMELSFGKHTSLSLPS